MYSSPHSASPRAGLVCAAALALTGGEAAAQALPSLLNQQVRIIVGFSADGSTGTMKRELANRQQEICDQPVITAGPRRCPLFLMRSAQGG
jgi:tripartite-type tricarboxylate transporter receptor subunit TctC